MGDRFLVPANSKSGQLIFNVFRSFDLILFLTGVGITLFLLVIIPLKNNMFLATLVLSPAGISTLLVLPVPNYHNVLVFLSDMLAFYNSRREYIWKGWCVKDDQYAKTDAYNRGMATNQGNK